MAIHANSIPTGRAKSTDADAATFDDRLTAFKTANAAFLRISNAGSYEDCVGEAACTAAGKAFDALIATPAPDARGVVAKLDAVCTWSAGCVFEEDEVLAVLADARRVIGGEA